MLLSLSALDLERLRLLSKTNMFYEPGMISTKVTIKKVYV